MDVPSMVQRSGDTLIVRSVVSGNQIYVDQGAGHILTHSSTAFPSLDNYQSRLEFDGSGDGIEELEIQNEVKDEGLPQCKIKRNYSCNSCTFFTQNPRHFLTHLRDSHGEKIVINECKLCLYASRHYQKLVRHMKMVHGSTEGIEEHSQARKRQVGREHRKRKLDMESIHAINPVPSQMLAPIEKYDDSLQEEGPQNRLLKCSVCDFTTLYRAQLVEHEQDEHYKTKFFRCEKCSYVTHIKARFSKHVKYHSMPMIKCVTCDFRTPYKWNLDRHMKNHGGTGPFKCAACNFTADIKQSLTVHEMNHHVPPVGHAAGMSMARRKNKVGATDIPEDFSSENGDISDFYNNNNNNVDDFEEPFEKKFKQEDEDQPTDLSQKGDVSRKARPIPNLIPIQTANNALNLTKIYEQFNKFVQKGLATPKVSSKDLSSLFLDNGEMCIERVDGPQLSPSSNCSSSTSKKKGSFFDQLKENFAATVSKNESLLCGCGHVSKCLSESIIHQKSCSREDVDKQSSQSPINLCVNSGSTRCQYCRHRCKSSVDLIAHLKICTEASSCRNESIDSSSNSQEKNEEMNCNPLEKSFPHEKHPMENRIFVWNNLSDSQRDDRSYGDQENVDEADDDKPPNEGSKCFDYLSENQRKENSENSYYGVETAPGYGEVTKKMTPEEEAANSSLKKVYKCPHCSFWASTASRFHVHIVGHLNKKPFECSLCNYRSNWRWDITKHIRLKTIRDPNHKNAKVLMNDETGRRNYTKYNKYITLMKVTEEDGDPKLMKSGEMTPNQEASLAFLNEYKRDTDFTGTVDVGPTKNLSAIDASRIMRMNFFPNAILGITGAHSTSSAPEQNKRSPPPLLKPSEDVLTQNIDVRPDGSEKRTMYKCRKCNYRNASRDMVLSHVKGHYQEAGINLSQNAPQIVANPLQVAVNPSLYMKNVIAAAMCLSQQQHQQQLTLNETSPQNQSLLSSSASSSPPGPPINRHHTLPIHQNLNLNAIPNHSQQLPSVVNSNTNTVIPLSVGTPPTVNQNTINSSNEHGEADEASSGVVTTTGTGVTGWRGPAPYRCGHCHQVSNWKHVIQRHCRLKHNGDIRIETIDRNTDKSTPVYYPLNSQPSTYSSSTVVANVLSGSNNFIGNTQPQVFNNDHQQSNQLSHCSQFVPPQQSSNETYKITDQEGSSPNIVAAKPRQHQCPSCPFVSDSKSQMMYHNSLHKFKSDMYQCQQCDYTCYKKQVLNQHIKTCHEDNQVLNNINLTENSSKDRFISFCSRCPARYIGSKDLNLHLKMHTASNSHRCAICSYTALQEPSLLAHSTVHSQTYNEKTAQLCRKFAEDHHYPRPKLISIALSSGEKVWVVERHSESDTDLDDAIAKSIICAEEDGGADRKPSLLKQQLELNSNNNDVAKHYSIEHCPHCPFETNRTSDLKSHMENHICISKNKLSSTCVHCDFSVNDDKILKEHVALHFKLIKNNNVAFYTSYDNLELNLEEVDGDCDKTMTRARKQQLLFKSDLSNGLDREQQINFKNDNLQQGKIIVDATTGDILSRSSM